MCDFHSVIGVAIGDNIFIKHLPSNSHSEMAGELRNLPNRQPVMFEAEWNGEGALPPDSKLIRNVVECPERLIKKIRDHYTKLQEAITTGKHFDGYFRDTEKWSDVWSRAISKNIPVQLPEVFKGNLAVSGSAKLDALVKVGGNLAVYGSAKLDALVKVGGYLAVSGSTKLDAPLLKEVGGYLAVSGSAKLDALVKVGGNLAVSGSTKLDAPLLKEVGGNLAVSGSAKLDAPLLKEVGGYLAVSGSAKLDALVKVGGNLAVYGSTKLDALVKVGGNLAVYGELIAPQLKR